MQSSDLEAGWERCCCFLGSILKFSYAKDTVYQANVDL